MSERGQRPSFNNQPRPNRAHGTSEIEGKVARVATSKLGDERVSNPGVILGRMFAVWPACNRDRMEPDGISDIESKVAR